MRSRKIRASVVALVAMAVFGGTSAESVKSCSAGSGSSSHHQTSTRKPFKNNEHVQQWCRNAQANDPDTWVYRFYNPATGEEGFIRGRGDAEVWKRLHHSGRINLHCK